MNSDLTSIAARFAVAGTPGQIKPVGTGHINDSYLVTSDSGQLYTLQRINHHVFTKPPELMENVVRITSHLRQKIAGLGGDPDRECLTVVKTHEGENYCRDGEGNYWRMYCYIDDAVTFDIVETPGQAAIGGRAYGRFQALLADLPGPALHETIPDFHNLPKRLSTFKEVAEKDTCSRAAGTVAEIKFVKEQAEALTAIHTQGNLGNIPVRITHNDTKFNNVLLHNLGDSFCVIDLDTVMNGYVHFDFGDAVRTVTNTGAEDEADVKKVAMDPELFRTFAQGYLEYADSFLTPTEREYLPLAGPMMTFMIGLRFLTDHLDGDRYFKIHYPDQNLDRARSQFALVRSMLDQHDVIKDAVLQ